MTPALTDQSANAATKLRRLAAQIEAVLGSEFPNQDSRSGARDLLSLIHKQIRRLDSFLSLSNSTRSLLLRDCNYKIASITELLGFIIRSTTSRNLFELYTPFIKLARVVVDQDVRLVLSSDWQFSPFTYPYGLDELPKYVLIGLPASESENVLVFPAAGHELGHNIWKAHKLRDRLVQDAENAVYDAFEANKNDLGDAFPPVKNASIRGDMIVQPIARSCLAFLIRQMEEVFCDMTGLRIFGSSYLYAFDYILSPSVSGLRDGGYPSTTTRATILENYGRDVGFSIQNYASRFIEEKLPDSKPQTFLIRMADLALKTLLDDLHAFSVKMVDDKVKCFSNGAYERAAECFSVGVPCLDENTLSDLINAAWIVYNKANYPRSNLAVDPIALLTDLVVKSAEISEFKEF